ncbi:glycosyltransferase family 4 protein [Christiangramia forsetii]|uniref:Glycosyl transferase, group 1 n=2 Tax=Christiangramia forsetii TaxID=411153 RepID=A0M2X3_CHRFK|nr:glycosyltransferase family 4 protein [Christiangramia forsetii]GGG27307.1 hypothetical protein GCM10011532_08430 [Christiangramia forsetii]CAL66968.1 glycosyl transferase, group 1 [Christiangramia forsetii KT0803]
MKILQLVTKRQYRGAEVFAANLSKELLLLGHDIIFVGLYRNDSNILEVPGAQHEDLVKAEKTFSTTLIKNLVKLIKRERPDVIQCNGSDTLKFMVAASFFTSSIPITYRNISMISAWLNGSLKTFIYRKMFKRIDHVTSVGTEAAEDFAVALQYPREQISVIRRGIPQKKIEHSSRASIKEDFGMKSEDRFAVHIGNFSIEKNHEFLLEVFGEIKKINNHLKLVLVGNGVLFEKIKNSIKEFNLQETVFVTGFRNDIPEILAAAHCFVLSSKVEGVPGVILEAAAQKVPAVATNVGGVKEVLINDHTGFIINDFNREKFAEKVIEILTNEALQLKLGSNAKKMVEKDFDPVKNAIKFEDLYRNLMSGSNVAHS